MVLVQVCCGVTHLEVSAEGLQESLAQGLEE